MLVSPHEELIEFARRFRNYGKPDYDQPGLNYRMNEFTAALGIVGVERLDEITDWKNAVAREELDPRAPEPHRTTRRDGLRASTSTSSSTRSSGRRGRCTTSPATALLGHHVDLPNSDWVAENHWCVPLYYRPVARPAVGGARVRVLVTGGAGFIGSHVVDRLIADGHEPVIFDLAASRVPPADRGARRCSATSPTATPRWRAARGCDAIIHLAAVADVNDVVADPLRADRINVHGTQMILEAARHAEISRVVYGSTVWVYGNAPAERKVDEETPLALPAHLYTATKLAGEMYCRSYTHLYALEHTILRFGIPYGPRARLAAVVPAFVDRAQDGKALTIAGDGRQTRQFVYVEDLAEASSPALAAGRRRTASTTSSATRRRACGRSRTRCASSSRRCRSSTGPSGRSTCTSRAISGERAADRARAGGPQTRVRRRRRPLPRLAERDERLAGLGDRGEHRRQRGRRSRARSPPSCSGRRRAAARRRRRRDRASRARRSTPGVALRSQSRPQRDQRNGDQPSRGRAAAPGS